MIHGAPFFEQCFFWGTFPLRMGNKYLDTLDWLCALCLTWLPADDNIAKSNIAQKVARVSSA